MRVFDKLFIDGRWVDPAGTGTIDVVDSFTEAPFASISLGAPADAEAAVAAARRAFDGWSQVQASARSKYLNAAADVIESRTEELAELMTRETGIPLVFSRLIQVGLPLTMFRAAAALTDSFRYEEELAHSLVVREPAGVVACITPWNYPLHQAVAKVAFAIGAGCTVVLKPSEVAPTSAFVLAEAFAAAGLPAGVFNLVTGTGPEVGEALAGHPDVDMVSFTGSTRAGKRVAQVGAETVKRVALELGGKSANILLDDLDAEQLGRAVAHALERAFLNSGQTCSALTRLLVPADRLADVEALVAEAVESWVVGDPFADGVRIGPLASATQRDSVERYIDTGIAEGARLVAGGLGSPEGLAAGFFVRPTVFSAVTPDMTIAQEEIFGPVLAILPYDGEDEAVRIANGVMYGLSGGVQSASAERAERVARRLRTGQVDVNGAPFNPLAPFGGYKQSGVGREYGAFGLEEFLEIKSIQRAAAIE